ncbi:MAG: hypothetical protein WCP19_01595 [Chloroflexota bacterium]
MRSDHDDNLLRQAILNIKIGEPVLARRYLEMTLDLADDLDTRSEANYWMSQITVDPVEKRKYLENTLANDPGHPEARKALAILDGKIKAGDIVNPDALPAQQTGLQQSNSDRFTCPKCGARMVFDGDGRTLICEHCSRSQVLGSSAPQFEQDFIMAMATGQGHRTPVKIQVFNCQGCGAEFILPALEISGNCAYCGSPHVVQLTRELVEPDSIVPMAFTQAQVVDILIGWFQKHRIKPDARVEKPKGNYMPAWTFDLLGLIPWTGTVYRNKKVVPVSGEETASYNDIIIPATGRYADMQADFLPGFETANAPAYDPRYLSGWPAEVYDLTMSDASLEARKQAVERVRSKIRSDKGNINDLNYSTSNLSILSFKMVLIPVWSTTYPLEGENYRVLVNGQTGRVTAEKPKTGLLGWLDDVLGE